MVVSAPTGAGKTAIAEAAAISVLARGQRVIYTTPLKVGAPCHPQISRKARGSSALTRALMCCAQHPLNI